MSKSRIETFFVSFTGDIRNSCTIGFLTSGTFTGGGELVFAVVIIGFAVSFSGKVISDNNKSTF
jgi:hypothetical protein